MFHVKHFASARMKAFGIGGRTERARRAWEGIGLMVYYAAVKTMSLIVAKNISKSFGAEDIFSGVSLAVPPRARIGIVGQNGSGKTTLIQILIGELSPDEGTIRRGKILKIGYLPQQITSIFDGTALEACRGVFADLLDMKAQLEKLEGELQRDPDPERVEAYGRLLTRFEAAGGFTIESRIRQVLQGLGLTGGEENRPWRQLSGGQKTRAYLARLLLMDPDLLVLDEPTNHLDIESVEFLESYLQSFSGAVLIVSHDRYFLDQVVNTIFELSADLEEYAGNYSAYLTQRGERYERRIKEYEAQQEFIAKEEAYIRRNIEGVNTRQAQGRRKRLERLLRDRELVRPQSLEPIRLRLRTDLRSGDLTLRTQGVEIGYPDDRVTLIRMPDVTLMRGECAAIVGPNGTGKSTLVKTILGQLAPLHGEVVMGANTRLGYFAQAHESLHPEWTVYDEIAEAAPALTPGEVRGFAARFLFRGDDAYKRVSALSGGERGRLAIALLSLQDANLLLLDEPMNHLDVSAQETLQSVLKAFNGTILLISHDRYLINAIATQLWIVRPEQRTIEVFAGTYSAYMDAKRSEKSRPQPVKNGADGEKRLTSAVSGSGKPVRSNNEQLRLEKRARALEGRITALETDLAQLGEALNRAGGSFTEFTRLSERYNMIESELNAAMDEWSSLDL